MKQKFLNLVLATMLLCFVSPAFAQVAKIGDTEYAKLSEAISAATDGETIVLTADVSQSVTINKNLTIDGAGKTYTGKMTIKEKGLFVTVNNVNFNGGNKAYDYGIVCEDINILTIENSTAKDFKTGFVYFKAGDKVNVNGVTVENVAAAFNVSRSNNSTFENVTLKNVTYGLHVQNYGERTYTLKNWTVENTDYITYVQNKDTKVVTFQLEGNFEVGNAKLHESQYAKYNKENIVVNVAKIGEQGYETLTKAVDAATAGQTITLIADVTEDVTISKNLTIDGAGKQYTGTMTANKGLTVTVQNVNFVNAGFDKPNAQNSTTGIYNIKNCTFDGAGSYAYPIRMYGGNQINVENCTVKDYVYSFLYVVKAALNVSVKNVTVENCPSYAIYFASGVTNANIEGLTVKNANNGLIINNDAARKLTIKDCKMETVATAINHSKGTFAINVTANGAIDFGGAAISQYVNLAGGTAIVAKVGEVNYLSLADAVAAAQAGETVELVNDATGAGVVINKNITIDFAGKTYTFNKTVGSAGTTTLGLQILKDNNVTLKNGTLTSTAVVAGKEVKMLIQNYANLTLENMNIVDATEHILYALSNNCGETLLTGNTNITTDAVAFDSYKDKAYTAPTVTVETTGKIAGKIEKSDDATIAIKSGIFTVAIDPAWCAEGYVPVANADGTYGVKEDPTIGKVAKVGEEYYKTVAAAITAAPAGATITLIADVNENVTISKNLTIDGAGKQYTGTMTGNAGLTVTVQNVNFVNGGFVKNKQTTTGTYTFKDCTFDGAGTYAYPLSFKGANTINVENCTVNNYLYGFLYVRTSAINVNVKNVTVENCPNYAIYFASGVNNANIEGLTVKNANNGLIINNAAARKLTIKDCKMENVATAINHSGDNTNAINVTANGVNDFGTAVMSQYVKLNAAAQVGTKVCGTLAEAVEAAQAGETVKLLSNVELSTFLTINKSITLNMGEYNITRADGTGLYVDGDVEVVISGTGKVSGAQALYVANGLVKVNGGNFVGIKEAVYVQLNGKVEIYDGKFEATDDDKTFVLNKKDSNRETTSITVYGGTFVGFNPANNAAEGKNTNFVAEGYASVDNGDGTYTVAEDVTPVAEVGGKTYGSLIAAFAAAQNGETVKLIYNVALDTKTLTTQNDGYSVILNVKDKAITLDLNGKNITVDAAAADVASAKGGMLLAVFSADLNGHLTLTDNTEAKNGTVTVNLNDAKVYCVFVSESAQSDKSNNGKITVEAGNYATNGKVSNAMFFADADEVITVNGGNFNCDGATTTSAYPWMFNTLDNDVIQVIVSGGTFNVNVSKQYRSAEVQLVEGKITADNGDGTWTVVPGYDEFTIVHDAYKGGAFVNEKDMPVNTLNYVRKFSNTNWRAFYVPFAINYDDIKDSFEVRRLVMAHDIEKADGSVEIKFDFMTIRDGQTLKANYPYLIRPKEKGEYTITVKNTTLKKTESKSINCSTVDHKFIFTGIYETVPGQVMVDSTYFAMNANELQYATDADKHALNPFNWYMKIETREDWSDVKFVFGGDFEDEETTGITNIDNDQIKNDGNIYDLQGRRVLQPQKGSLYIVNGKKVVF